MHVSGARAGTARRTVRQQAFRAQGGPEVLQGDSQDLLSTLLALLVRDAQQVAHERCVALGIRQLVGVDVPNGAYDCLCQGVLIQFHTSQEVCCPVVHIHLRVRACCGIS